MESDTTVEDYIQQSRDFLQKARQYLAADDLHQASEKGWGAASHMAKAVAHANGWEYEKHHQFNAVLNNARRLTRRGELLQLSAVANQLHGNYYERKRFLDGEAIGLSLDDVETLMDILEPVALDPA